MAGLRVCAAQQKQDLVDPAAAVFPCRTAMPICSRAMDLNAAQIDLTVQASNVGRAIGLELVDALAGESSCPSPPTSSPERHSQRTAEAACCSPKLIPRARCSPTTREEVPAIRWLVQVERIVERCKRTARVATGAGGAIQPEKGILDIRQGRVDASGEDRHEAPASEWRKVSTGGYDLELLSRWCPNWRRKCLAGWPKLGYKRRLKPGSCRMGGFSAWLCRDGSSTQFSNPPRCRPSWTLVRASGWVAAVSSRPPHPGDLAPPDPATSGPGDE